MPMKGLVRRAAHLALGWRSFVPASKRAIFAYHDVSPRSEPQHSPGYSTDPDLFQRHLDLLQSAFQLVSLDQIVTPGPPGPKPLAALTFDDGFTTVRTRVQPLLAARRIPFTLFLNGRAMREGRLDYLPQYRSPPVRPGFYLTGAEVRALAQAGVQIGNHTTSHRPLVGLSDAQLNEELVQNRAYLEELTGTPVRHLALPYGKKEHYDDRGLARCFSTGHRHVYGTNPVLFDAESLPTFARAPIPRIGLTDNAPNDILFLVNRPMVQRIDL
jgi:peptidoglycan/xylan/chitin deacetylase (PgdA/CDA1 family)